VDIRLDLVGGMAGDMFIAALLDAFPALAPLLLDNIAATSADGAIGCQLLDFDDSVLTGKRFNVTREIRPEGIAVHACHEHATWQSIRAGLRAAAIDPSVRQHAIAIFELLADAEGAVHGVRSEDVAFHEVGAWDSIADIVGAATLIHALQGARWSCSPVPLGAGRVTTAHGILAVPAPATVRLLLGMSTLDDGIAGERVTPTGAAILRYLCGPDAEFRGTTAVVRRLVATGCGFGSRALRGISNHVRVLAFQADPAEEVATVVDDGSGGRDIHVIEFEVDDQSGEDLATGLDRLRVHPGILDVVQCPVFGKKGRIMMHVRVLVREQRLDDGIEACFRETTTIGLRHRVVKGVGLKRAIRHVDVDGERLRVKLAERPGGRTAKAESDDLGRTEGQALRTRLRRRAEAEALLGSATDV
jgi:uncharacterized protein (TIGR00299 family) protein